MRNKKTEEPEVIKTGRSSFSITLERKEDETMERYRERRKIEKDIIKEHLKGTQTWDSDKQGTYIKNKKEKKND